MVLRTKRTLGLVWVYQLGSVWSMAMLIKTKETFKLGDLQYLASQLEFRCCKRRLVDAATGSSLLEIQHDRYSYSSSRFLSSQCDWMGEILARASSPDQLVTKATAEVTLDHPWTLRYVRMISIPSYPTVSAFGGSYTKQTLLNAVSNALPKTPAAALDPNTEPLDRLIVVDATTATGASKFFLLRLLQSSNNPCSSPFRAKWSQRPFLYSSAMNPDAVELIVDALLCLLPSHNRSSLSLFDPCCGSGSFLVAALDRGLSVTGWDSNPTCVEGARSNLAFLHPNATTSHCDIHHLDSTLECHSFPDYDSAVCNLPWGLNTQRDAETNQKILERLSERAGAPCAIVSKGSVSTISETVQQLGFRIVGQAEIPPAGFSLPKSKKKKADVPVQLGGDLDKGRSHCVVTIVQN